MDQKHPHGRGEDLKSTKKSAQARETPPRAWGRRAVPALAVAVSGNTPTGVGKTVASAAASGLGRKHPHGRGEDFWGQMIRWCSPETPPRAWGRPCPVSLARLIWGNTPTGVGKTHHVYLERHKLQKHPHGRGEDDSIFNRMDTQSETPPRAWGRLYCRETSAVRDGNTPTGVGKTRTGHLRAPQSGKHPHGRGEDWRELARCLP